jgi:hypothetical protein
MNDAHSSTAEEQYNQIQSAERRYPGTEFAVDGR